MNSGTGRRRRSKGGGPPGVVVMAGWRGGWPEVGGENGGGVGWSGCSWKRKKRKKSLEGRRRRGRRGERRSGFSTTREPSVGAGERFLWGVQWRRKKEEEAEEENLQRGEGRPRGGCAYRRWGFGFVGRLRRRLFVEEECFCGVSKGWRSSGERERRENVGWKKNRGEADFLAYFGPDFLLPQAIKSTSIYMRWNREISST